MSDANANKTIPVTVTPSNFTPESQGERRLKYGIVVTVTVLIAAMLVAGLVYVAERKPKRFDTTSAGLYSLKPQTVGLIKDNKEKIKIVSLYTKSKPPQQQSTSDLPSNEQSVADQAQIVADLLEEYQNKGSNITAEVIDPVTSPTKVDDLIADVAEKYGGQIEKYKKFSDTYKSKYAKIVELGEAELGKVKPLAAAAGASEQVKDFVDQLSSTLTEFPKQLQVNEAGVKRALKEKPPNYKGVADAVQGSASVLSEQFAATITQFKQYKEDAKVPTDVRKYMTESLPRYEEIKKAADAIVDEIKGLGELKLDTLREALRQKNSILVRGENDWKVLAYDQVWRKDQRDLPAMLHGGKLKSRFAGEQMITTAILSLSHPKKLKVAFVRAGGPPLTDEPTPEIPGFQRGKQGGFLSAVAGRLGQYNFEVLEKDLTGMYATMAQQQAQQQGGMPPTPEPSDADIKDAVWVVLAGSGQANNPMGGPPPSVAAKLMEHLQQGGSAMVLASARGEDLSIALKSWGIEVHNEAMAVHELVDRNGTGQADMIEEAKKRAYIFELRDWGDSPVTSPIRSLSGILAESVIVKTTTREAGVTTMPIIPIPGAPAFPNAWGETDFSTIDSGPVFDAKKDMTGPLFAGAIAEKQSNGARVVVLGAPYLFAGIAGQPMQGVVDFPDPELLKRNIVAKRFPGNAELFTNSIFWLSHQDPMIAISPAAMDVNRIDDMSASRQKLWRVGVLLIGLPGAVLLAGALVYLKRRD